MSITSFPSAGNANGGYVSVTGYAGMWGNKVWFVDYDNGTAGATGDRPDAAQKNLQTIIDKALEWDTIFIRPRDPDATGGDPQAIIPVSTTNFSTTYTQHGLSFIGTGIGYDKSAAYQTRIQAASTVQATPGFLSKAPFTTFENITFRRGGSTSGALRISGERTTDVGYSFGCTVNNCVFWKVGATGIDGGLYLQSSWHTSVINSLFMECAIGIRLGSAESDLTGTVIRNCDFDGLDTTINSDIWSDGIVHNTIIDRCRFNHDQPALGGSNKYFVFGAGCDGMVTQCYFGTETATLSTAATYPAGVQVVHSFYEAATNLTA